MIVPEDFALAILAMRNSRRTLSMIAVRSKVSRRTMYRLVYGRRAHASTMLRLHRAFPLTLPQLSFDDQRDFKLSRESRAA